MAVFCPRRRQRDLRVEEFQGEVLVYDLASHRAHCLNGLAAAIWRLCDGSSSITDISRRVAGEQGTDPNEDLIRYALAELDGAGLLDPALDEAPPVDPSRRNALAMLGWVAGIPLVLSIAVPEPAYAQSGPTGPTGP